MRDVLSRARAVLDNAMYAAAEAAAKPPLNSKERGAVYFPLAANVGDWNAVETKRHMMVLTQDQRDALRAIQPFVTGNAAVSWFNKIHNDDKHRRPLELAVIPDPEFVMLFNYVEPPLSDMSEYGTV